jgi:outer membrane protein assembly factor BamA
LEYRFPIKLVNRGVGLFPLHLDWLSGVVFIDGGNAWGPDLGVAGFENPRRNALASAGAEVMVRTLPLWFQNMNLRVGIAFPLAQEDDPLAKENSPRSYLRFGLSF